MNPMFGISPIVPGSEDVHNSTSASDMRTFRLVADEWAYLESESFLD